MHWIKTRDEPVRLFITGGAGVGKSVLARALFKAMSAYWECTDGGNVEAIKVLMLAPTGS